MELQMFTFLFLLKLVQSIQQNECVEAVKIQLLLMKRDDLQLQKHDGC